MRLWTLNPSLGNFQSYNFAPARPQVWSKFVDLKNFEKPQKCTTETGLQSPKAQVWELETGFGPRGLEFGTSREVWFRVRHGAPA